MNFPPAPGEYPDEYPVELPDNRDIGDFQFQNNSELPDSLINGTNPFSPNSVNIYVTISIFFLDI